MRLILADPLATRRLGEAIANCIEERAVFALVGDMGAGKTTLVKAVAAGLGVEEIVNSPTFTMLNEYHSGRLSLFHMDLYRLKEASAPAPVDLLLAEIEEFIDQDMVAMIEWAELFPVETGTASTTSPVQEASEDSASEMGSTNQQPLLSSAAADGSKVSPEEIGLSREEFHNSPKVQNSMRPPERSTSNHLGQLDHIVLRLESAYKDELRSENGLSVPILPGSPDGRSGSVQKNDINKDEEVRIATMAAHGRSSEELLKRLGVTLAAMLIYS